MLSFYNSGVPPFDTKTARKIKAKVPKFCVLFSPVVKLQTKAKIPKPFYALHDFLHLSIEKVMGI
jgi:hypothetical protein